jgi:hypothetical protein
MLKDRNQSETLLVNYSNDLRQRRLFFPAIPFCEFRSPIVWDIRAIGFCSAKRSPIEARQADTQPSKIGLFLPV